MLQAIRNCDELRDYVNRGNRVDYVFFWRPRPTDATRVGSECLSQWYPSPFAVDGMSYATAEHFMMAEKARLFEDAEIESQILNAQDPAVVRKLGRRVRGFDEACWNLECVRIVVAGNLAKFSQHAALNAFLRSTGEAVLVEASPKDAIWGIGLAADHPDAGNPNQWQGLNLLGFALMEARHVLTGA